MNVIYEHKTKGNPLPKTLNGDIKEFIIIIIILMSLLLCFEFWILKETQEFIKYTLLQILREIFKFHANQCYIFDSVLILKQTFRSYLFLLLLLIYSCFPLHSLLSVVGEKKRVRVYIHIALLLVMPRHVGC